VHQERASIFNSYNFDFGSILTRNWLQANLAGEHAQCTFLGLYLTQDRQHIDNHTRIEHQVPHTTSREYYKGVLLANSRAVFNGQIFIAPHAQKAEAQQHNRNLLLSSNAEIDSKPEKFMQMM
jgi:Fe-S cluster assembly protein SufD